MKIILVVLLALMPFMVNAQLQNSSFENWSQDTLGNYYLDNWELYASAQVVIPNGSLYTTWRTNTAYEGTHALMLSRWYNYNCYWVKQITPIHSRPWGISGYYKYTDNELAGGYLDSALVEIILTKWNNTTGKTDTVGIGNKLLTGTSTFTLFNCSVQYISTNVPDTAIVHIRPMPWFTTHLNKMGLGSYLTIDDLSFEARTTSIKQINSTTVKVYPNPTEDDLTIEDLNNNTCVQLIDAFGKIIYRNLCKSTVVIPTKQLPNGYYVLQFNYETGSTEAVKVVKE